jgi:hypothetical protein
MAELLDCMVNYFGSDGDCDGVPRRYYCYHVVAGPGPDEGTGVATISTLAVHEGDRPCDYCQNCFFARAGGPKAALARALLSLDAYHDGHRLGKVVSQVRRAPRQDYSEQRKSDDDHGEQTQAAPRVHRPGRDG